MTHLRWVGMALVLVVLWLGWLLNAPVEFEVPQAVQETEASPVSAADKAVISADAPRPISTHFTQDDIRIEHRIVTSPTSDEGEPTRCMSPEALRADPRYALLLDWFDVELGFGKQALSNQYGFYDEPTLLEAAELGDSLAMLALGINYRFHATSEYFVSDKLYLVDGATRVRKPRERDEATLKKARYWLYQAALHGKLAGLSELQWMEFDRQKYFDDDEQGKRKKRDAVLNAAAYHGFLTELLPNEVRDNNAVKQLIKDDEQALYEQKMAVMRARWREARAAIGLPQSVQLDVPEAMVEFIELSRQVCAASADN